MNNTTLVAAEKWFNELGIETQLHPNCLMVKRLDLMAFDNAASKEEAENTFIIELRNSLKTSKLFWANRNETWVYLESF